MDFGDVIVASVILILNFGILNFGMLLILYFFAALQILDSNQCVCDVTLELLIPDLGYVTNVLSFGHPTSNLSFFQALIL